MPHYRRTITRLALLGAALALSPLIHAQSSRPAVGDHRTWYLAEGATNDFFQEEILIANPNSGAASVQVAFLKSDGAEVVVPVNIPAFTRHTMRVNTIPGLENANASATITSDVDILVERSMYWPGPARRGGHNAMGVPSPATKWYFAEGSLGFFQTYFLIANPSDTPADVKVTYLRSSGGPLQQTLTVPARSRDTIWVNDEQPEAGAFSAVIESTNGVADHRGAGDVLERLRGRPRCGGRHRAGEDVAVPRRVHRKRVQDLPAGRESEHAAERGEGRRAVRRWGVADDVAVFDGAAEPRDVERGRLSRSCAIARSRSTSRAS